MIVDDETAIREQLPVAFEWAQYGFEVIATAANGKDAIEKTEKYHPDLILLDIRMPVMDGLAFLKWLRESPQRETKVLILTGYSEFEYAITAMRFGAKGYLNKPLDEDEIADYLTRIAEELAVEKNSMEQEKSSDLAKNTSQYIDTHYMEPITVSSIAAALYVTPAYLGQVFRKAMNMTIRQYLKTVRIERAKELLERTLLHVYEIAQRVGFADSKYFVVSFEEETGLSPAAYRKENSERNDKSPRKEDESTVQGDL